MRLSDFKNLVNSQEPVKMNVFLKFVFNSESLRKNVKDEWSKEFDVSYIETNLIGGIEKHLPTYSDLLSVIEKKATGKAILTEKLSTKSENKTLTETELVSEKSPKKVTIVEPFKITEIVKKEVKVEEEVIEKFKAQPVPEEIYKISYQQMEEQQQKKRESSIQQTKEKYEKGVGKFNLKTEERPMFLETIKKECEEKIEKELQFNKKFQNELKIKEPEIEVKTNIATILREEKVLTKKEIEEEKKIKEAEMNLHDSSEFDRWKEQMKEKDKIERENEVQKRKLEMEMARQNAIDACTKKLNDNKKIVKKAKKNVLLN